MERKVSTAWCLIAILSFSVLSVNWLSLSGTTEFTSGKPERSELIVEIEVDSEETTQEIRIEKATPFVLWMLVRDSVSEDSESESSDDSSDESEQESYQSDTSSMENMQSLLTALVSMFGFLGILSILNVRIPMRWMFLFWAIGLVLFVCLPLAWVGDMGQSLDSGLPEEQGPEEDGAFVHVNSETNLKIVFIGVEFQFLGDGWDLGMIEENERNATIAEPPSDEEHDAHITWSGEISLRYGNALTIWLVVGLLLLIITTFERSKKGPEVLDSEE